MTKKTIRSQTRSIGLLGLVNVATSFLGILQAFVIGRLFGISSGIEIYFAAVVFYQSVLRLTQTGQIGEMFIPIYHELKASRGQETAYHLLSVFLNWLVSIAIAISSIIYFLAPWIVPWTVPGFDASRQATCIQMFQGLVPLLGLTGANALLVTLIVAEKKFVAAEVSKLGTTVVGLLLIASLSGDMGAWVMILAMWVSTLAPLVIFGYILFRNGYRYSLRFSHKNFSVWSIFKKMPSIFGYVTFAQVNSLVMTAGLSLLPQGSLAIFTYARKVTSNLRNITLRPVSVVFYSHFSSALFEGDKAVTNLTHKALRIILVLVTFATVVTVAAGNYGLRALWMSETFPEYSVFQTYYIVCVLCLLTSLLGLSLIFRKINSAHQLFSHQYLLLALVQIAGALMAYFLIPIFGLSGAIFVLIATAILGLISSGVLLRIKCPHSFAIYRLSDICKCLIILATSTVPLLWLQFQTDFYPSLWGGRLGDLFVSGIYFLISMLLAIMTAHSLKIPEVCSLLNLIAQRVRRRPSEDSF